MCFRINSGSTSWVPKLEAHPSYWSGTHQWDSLHTSSASKNMNKIEHPAKSKAKKRKYRESYLALGFTTTMVGNEERPQRAVYPKILAADSLKANKIRRHLETTQPKHKDNPVDFFEGKLTNCHARQSINPKAA